MFGLGRRAGLALWMPDAGSSPSHAPGHLAGLQETELSTCPTVTSMTLRGSAAPWTSNVETQLVRGERDWLDHRLPPTAGEQDSFSFGLSQSQDSREVSSWVRRAELREGSWPV